jgi:hypothetical protein
LRWKAWVKGEVRAEDRGANLDINSFVCPEEFETNEE